mmetsp:Transcript_18034/g.27580  ORF Transcript_18034/g.27580 Transcript_18034/m.27580 type:complete len:357 (+) Transcript_18034:15109-16179(+)
MGLRLFGSLDHLRLCRVGTAIKDVLTHRTVQQRTVLLDHPDIEAQAVLGDLRDVLPVDFNPPRLRVIETEKQFDQSRLARTRATNQAHLFAGLDMGCDGIQAPAAPAIVMGQTVQGQRAVLHRQRFCARRIDQCDRLSNRFHAFGNDPKLAEECGQRPHDPAGHRVQAQGQSGGCSHNTNTGSALRPKRNRPTHDAHDQQAIQGYKNHIHNRIKAHLSDECRARQLNRLFGVFDLAVVVRKHLDGMNIGIGIDHPARRRGPRIRCGLRCRAHTLDRPGHKTAIKDEPNGHRDHQTRVRNTQQNRGTNQVGQREGNGVEHLKHHFARSGGRLHDAVGDAAGKVILEPTHRLAQHVFM